MSLYASMISQLQPRAFSEFRTPKAVRPEAGGSTAAIRNTDGDTFERAQPALQDLDNAEQKSLQALRRRDREVRTHEQAHVQAGGSLVKGPFYTFEEGPDGRRYAVDGEVVIDTAPEPDPERTIAKMRRVKAAATAPVNPSPQDMRVAAEASRKEAVARAELRKAELDAATQESAEETGFAENILANTGAEPEFTFRTDTNETGTTAETLNLRRLAGTPAFRPRPQLYLETQYGTFLIQSA